MKYHSKKVHIDNETFDSKKEYKRYLELKEKQRKGEIRELKRQVKFELIPTQYEIIGIYTKGQKKGLPKRKVVQRPVAYIADFTYIENEEYIVEDSKGYRTTDYILKKKMMYYFKKIKIRET